MSGESTKEACFVDSNIWLYILLPGQDDQKAAIAKELIRREGVSIHLSAQVVSEVVYGVIRHAVLNETEIRELVGRLYARYEILPITEAVQLTASDMRENYALSYWDSLIVAAALQAGAASLFSEDMQHGLVVGGHLTIRNPFA